MAEPVGALRRRIPQQGGPLLPAREQVRHALILLSVPAAPRMIIEVHGAFFGASDLTAGTLADLRRDEERAYRTEPHTHPYHLCAALTADRLTPTRGLFALSCWPLERRVVGPLSPRVDHLTATVRIAAHAGRLAYASREVTGLLRRLAEVIPGGVEAFDVMRPAGLAEAAMAELAVHAAADTAVRAAAAERARAGLSDAAQLFGDDGAR